YLMTQRYGASKRLVMRAVAKRQNRCDHAVVPHRSEAFRYS
ncbi:MAG: hypothetical protein RLZ37_774, partial [Actinomycetota bacterium]